MLETRAAGILSARFALIFVSVFVSPVAVQTQVRTVRDVTDDLKNSHVLIPQFTGLDCDFGLEKECLWNWDADNFTGSTRGSTVYPGQNGFYRTNGEEVARLYSESSKNFFGPNKDSNNSTKGPFLYLLGRPLSDVANFTDKRIISQLIRESGNNCSVEIKLFYQNVKGAIIEFGTQNFAKAYSPIKEIIFTPANHTSHEGWKTFSIQYGRYVDPFSVSIDFKRSKFSETGSFIAIDDIKLVNCEPESSVPIDCSSKPSRNYGCPGGLGSPCLDGPSMLCDLKPDCPNGDDEKEDACYLMPREARCDFNNDDDFCGWRDPNGHLHRIAQWQRKKGQTKLEGIRGDLSHKNQGHYLYVSYEPGQDGTPGHGATLRSPAFPPPPKYNNNATSPYFKSCRIRLSYHMLSNSNTRRPGPLDLVVNFVNESSGSKSVMRPIHLTLDVPMGKNREGWIRWEAALPHQTQLRYYLSLIGSNGFGAKAELAVDDLSLSPQCFGQGVSPEHVGAWRYNMTDLEFCMYYGRSDCLSSKKSYGYKFSTCNAYGPLGPFPELCNEDYAGTSTSVMIGDVTKKGQESHQLGYVTGIQRWTVPATGIYTIIASGASGARGRQNNIQSYGDEIRALINLEANETIFILVGQMGISVCNNNGLLDDNSDCKGNDRQRRSPDPADYFYDLLQGEVQEQSETEDDEEEDDDNMYGKIIFAPFSSESNRGRQRRSVPAFMPRSSDNRRTPGKQARPDSMSELVRMMALSDGSTVPSTRMAANEDGSLDEEIIEQDKLHKQPQTSDEDHGRVHVSSDTMVQSQEKATYFNNVDQGPKQGGGGGGGATFIFRFIGNGTVQPLLIAAGGGGASDQQSTSLPGLHDAKGLVDPRATLAMLMKMVSQDDSDAGSGGGWNSNLSQACNFSIIHMNYQEKNKAQSTGFSMADSWMGGFPCSPNSEQWGGFGGGGAGCLGGGGGGGYIGGKGGTDQFTNGEGGWSYYNPDAILLVLDARTEAATSVVHMTNTGGQGNGAALEKLWKHQGQGRVFVIPSMPHDRSCQSNCSAFGAACVTLDPEMKKTQCVCPNGRLLDHINPKCNDELPLFVMAVIGVACVVTMAILGLLCMFLYTQYQRKHMQMLRRKMMSGPVVEGQLNRLRAMNVNVNINGVTMTEYNPNYEFGGGTCTLQDLREIPRENLRLVKALGQGAFGEVYQGFYKKSSSDTLEMSVAVKTLPELSSNQAEMDFLMEALIMSKFKHPNIVHFIGVCFEKHPRFIVLELLAGGDLKTFLRDSRPKPDRASPLVMRDLLLCAMDVAKGCEYLENNHFIHRDIAARNCLLTSKGPGRVAKIADFGMARDIYRGDYYRKGGKAMLPVKWMPPEAFLDGIFTSKTDVWSFGILLWEVMSLGYMPYPGRGNQEVMQLVTNGGRLEPPNYCPGPVYGLMCQCWHPIPEERPNFRTILERLGYCIQDPEVVMAPLPVCHRPMTSLENSRETSLSSGRGGGATTGSSADSGSGFSLPMRGAGAKGRPGQPNARSANVTPDSPGTTVTLAGASSSDYLVPLTGMPTRPAGLVTTDAQKRKSSRESIPASSPSDVPASDDEDSEMLLRRPSLPLTGEAETSFSCPPPSASARRAGGYTSLPQTESVTSKNRPNRRRRPSGSSSNKKLHQKSLSKNSINQIPPGSSSSSTSSCEPTSTRHPRSRLPSTSHPLEAAIEPPKRTTSVIASLQQDGVVNGLPLPPPPPRGYSDSSPSTKDDLSPVLPPLPPLPDEVRTPADKLPLDVSSLRAQHRHMVPYMNMDSNPGSPPRPSVITNPTPYVIHAPSSTNSSTTSTRPKATEPPSEISV